MLRSVVPVLIRMLHYIVQCLFMFSFVPLGFLGNG